MSCGVMYIWRRVWGGEWGCGGSEFFGRPILIFYIKKNWIALWPDMLSRILIYYWQEILLLTLGKPWEPNWQWSHSLMIPLHCLSTKSNNKTRGQFECGMTWFCLCFDFIGSHAREGETVEGMRGGVRLGMGVEGGGSYVYRPLRYIKCACRNNWKIFS